MQNAGFGLVEVKGDVGPAGPAFFLAPAISPRWSQPSRHFTEVEPMMCDTQYGIVHPLVRNLSLTFYIST
jgi:hypothetical protein